MRLKKKYKRWYKDETKKRRDKKLHRLNSANKNDMKKQKLKSQFRRNCPSICDLFLWITVSKVSAPTALVVASAPVGTLTINQSIPKVQNTFIQNPIIRMKSKYYFLKVVN